MNFDDWFADQTRQAFDSYTEQPSTEDWKKMEFMLNKSNAGWQDRRIWTSAAAILIALLSGYYFLQTPEYSTMVQTETIAEPNIQDSLQRNFDSDSNSNSISDSISDSNANSNSFISDTLIYRDESQKSEIQPKSSRSKPIQHSTQLSKQILHSNPIESDETVKNESQPYKESVTSTPIVPPLITEEISHSTDSLFNEINLISAQSDEIHESEYIIQPNDLIRSKQTKRYADVQLGSMVSMINKEWSNGIGVVVGLVHFWKLSDKFHLGTGGLLAQNDAQFSRNSNLLYANIDAAMNATEESPVSISTKQKIQTLALEIPLLMRWNFYQSTSRGIGITAGISSLIYVKQTLNESGYNYSGVEVQTQNGESSYTITSEAYTTNESVPSFAHNDWAGIMHIATSYRFNKRWETELFLKLPLHSLTKKQLEMSFSGFSLRYTLFEK